MLLFSHVLLNSIDFMFEIFRYVQQMISWLTLCVESIS